MAHYDDCWEVKIEDALESMEEEYPSKLGTTCDRNKPIKEKEVVSSGFSWKQEAQVDNVKQPQHYMKFDTGCIGVIACCLTKEAFKGYCLGNFLKYRFRMGDKGDMQEDFAKSNEYKLIYEKYSHLCRDMPF